MIFPYLLSAFRTLGTIPFHYLINERVVVSVLDELVFYFYNF